MKKNVFLVMVCCVAMVASSAFAGEVDILLQKLVEKGVLTAGEAQEIKTETQEQVKKEVATGKSASLPAWVQNTKLKGDFRLRYQHTDKDNNAESQHRGRYRLRVGLESKVNDKTKVGFGLASGSDASTDSRSTNATFSGNFGKKYIYIDYAFLEYMPKPWVSLIGGRMSNPLWRASDMLWDSDINTEGGAAKLAHALSTGTKLFGNMGAFVLNESGSDASDPCLLVMQPGIDMKLNDTVGIKAAVTYYNFINVKNGSALSHTPSTSDGYSNTNTMENSRYKYDYDAINPGIEISITEPFKALGITKLTSEIPYLAFFGESITNFDPDDNNNGWIAGVKLGKAKVGGWKDWQLRYSFRRLSQDAWLATYPDSDFYGGTTNCEGHEVLLTFGLAKNVFLDLDYYRTQPLSTSKAHESLMQVDLNLKF